MFRRRDPSFSAWPWSSPYGAPSSPRPLVSEPYKELVEEGYIFVFQDIRGRYQSEGRFVMQRPPRDKSDPRAIDESTDAYDTVEWLLKNVPGNNGRAGLMGISYGGWLTAMAPYLVRMTVPTLNVAGWWDQEDFYGPQKIYETLEPRDRAKSNFFVAGPWNHGGWMRTDGSALGRIQFGANTSKYFREKIQAPFFAHSLKDKGGWDVREAVTFETGTNAWQLYDEWPPRKLTADRNLYFREDGRLSFEAPTLADAAAFDSYVSDPARPVPYRPRPIEATYDPRGSGWGTWLVGDQRFAYLRPDVLSWETEPLVTDRVTEFTIDLHAADHRFLKGHRIMVQVQSTWFPLIDRNPQTFVENIFLAKASDYRPATHRVFRSAAHPSRIVVPVRTH
jgi:predicted acyl esterase